MTESMTVYGMVFAKLAIGLLAIMYLGVLLVPLFTMTKLVFYSLC